METNVRAKGKEARERRKEKHKRKQKKKKEGRKEGRKKGKETRGREKKMKDGSRSPPQLEEASRDARLDNT